MNHSSYGAGLRRASFRWAFGRRYEKNGVEILCSPYQNVNLAPT
jgi:hypothetical protein